MKSHYHKYKEFFHAIFWRGFQFLGKQGLGMLSLALMVFLLNPLEYGKFEYATAVIIFLTVFCDFGISAAVGRYAARYIAARNKRLTTLLWSSVLLISSLAVVIALLIFIFGKYLIAAEYLLLVFSLLPLLLFAPLVSVQDGMYRANGLYRRLSLIALVSGIVNILALFVFIPKYGALGAAISYVLSYFVNFLLLIFGMPIHRLKLHAESIKEIGAYALVYGIGAISYFLFSKIDVLIMGHYGYIQEIAIYSFITKVCLFLLAPFYLISDILAPKIAALTVKKTAKTIKNKLFLFVRYLIPSAAVFGIIGFFLLWGIFSVLPKYHMLLVIPILVPSVLIFALISYATVINSSFIVSTGHAHLMMKINIVLGIFNTIFSILVASYGAVYIIYITLISHLIAIVWLHTKYFGEIRKNA